MSFWISLPDMFDYTHHIDIWNTEIEIKYELSKIGNARNCERMTVDTVSEIPYSKNMTASNRKSGRPKLDATESLLPYSVRLRPAELVVIETAANLSEQNPRQWIRSVCVSEALELIAKRKNDGNSNDQEDDSQE